LLSANHSPVRGLVLGRELVRVQEQEQEPEQEQEQEQEQGRSSLV
jgi:hypothetical protein